ncbi:MAG: hypothetical protein RLZZ336_986 [Cyanobacteriota bacterium]
MPAETTTASSAAAPTAAGDWPPASPEAATDAAAGAAEAAAAVVDLFRERFETLIPAIQRHWPEVARHTLEATRGSFDEVAQVIASQSGRTAHTVRRQLLELVAVAGDQTQRLGESLEPLEHQLESLLDELNATLRPRIEKPVRERPLLALGVAAGVGLVLGLLLSSGRRSA